MFAQASPHAESHLEMPTGVHLFSFTFKKIKKKYKIIWMTISLNIGLIGEGGITDKL